MFGLGGGGCRRCAFVWLRWPVCPILPAKPGDSLSRSSLPRGGAPVFTMLLEPGDSLLSVTTPPSRQGAPRSVPCQSHIYIYIYGSVPCYLSLVTHCCHYPTIPTGGTPVCPMLLEPGDPLLTVTTPPSRQGAPRSVPCCLSLVTHCSASDCQ